ncbi:MAG: four helix bundle protein [Bacteroidia bacterium]|nr:four helix bundle protein [Bacteroidia bacterium]
METKYGYKSLMVYKKSYQLAMNIFTVSKSFPADERFGLTSQIRRSSRSVCANLVEGYRKREYQKNFYSKLSICDGELGETALWLDIALDCEYITRTQHEELFKLIDEVERMLGSMMRNPEKFLPARLKSPPKT